MCWYGGERLGVAGAAKQVVLSAQRFRYKKRTYAIAAPNERAGITCYLINGVCHQAANRISLPAGILSHRREGLNNGVSSALFGLMAGLRGPLGTCSAPFNQHTGVTGDLPRV